MLANITVTGFAGPGNEMTANLFPNCTDLNYQFAASVFSFKTQEGRTVSVDMSDTTTITMTISGTTVTATITNA